MRCRALNSARRLGRRYRPSASVHHFSARTQYACAVFFGVSCSISPNSHAPLKKGSLAIYLCTRVVMMSSGHKRDDKQVQRVCLSSTNPLYLEEEERTRQSSGGEPGTVTTATTGLKLDVEMEEMMDVRPNGPTSINEGGEGERVAVGKKYREGSELLDAAAVLSDGGGEAVVERWTRNRLYDSRREFGLRTLSHALSGFTGEFVGTFLLTLCIISAVAASVIADALVGIWQVAVLCGLGVAISIYLSAHISDAHLNPAVTLAFAILRFRAFSWKKIVVYVTAQMLGGFAAGAVLFGTYHNAIVAFEEERGIQRGLNGSVFSAMIFGEYFPNPALFPDNPGVVSHLSAFVVEAWATGVLVFVIFAFTDPHNTTVGSGKHKVPVPILIGATVMILISLYGPLTQAGLNPARDFGPRLFAAAAGWGKVAIPGPRKGFWVYIVGPLVGGLAGGALYDLVAAKAMQFRNKMKSQGQRYHKP